MRELFLIEETRTVIRYADIGVSQLQETLEKSDGLFWLDIEQMEDEDAALLRDFKEFGFHPRSIDACRAVAGRPTLSEFPDHLFLTLYTLDDRNQTDTAEMVKLCIFLTPDYLATVHAVPLPFLQQIKDRIEQDYMLMRSPGFCLAMILEAMLDHLDPAIAHLDGEISAMGNLIAGAGGMETLRRVNRMKRHVLALHQMLQPQGDMLHELITRTYPQMQPETIIQIRTMYHRLICMVESLVRYREMLSDLRDEYFASISTRMNAATGRLTTVAVIFLPLICLAALLGMDRQLLPGIVPPYDMLIAACFLAVVAILIGALSRRE